jgi:hypothetical protein
VAAGASLVASTASAERFRYRHSFVLSVGQSKVVYAVRHRDCKNTPSFARVRGRLPKTRLGRYSDGGAMTGKSRSCGKVVPVRGIRFRAARRGTETLTFFGYKVTLTLR